MPVYTPTPILIDDVDVSEVSYSWDIYNPTDQGGYGTGLGPFSVSEQGPLSGSPLVPGMTKVQYLAVLDAIAADYIAAVMTAYPNDAVATGHRVFTGFKEEIL